VEGTGGEGEREMEEERAGGREDGHPLFLRCSCTPEAMCS